MPLKRLASIRRTRTVSIANEGRSSASSPNNVIAFYVTFSEQSGGIFVDAGIHIVSLPGSNDVDRY